MIEIRDCELALGPPRHGVRFVLPSLRIERGARVGIVGPSGCGKSTLLEIIAGLRRADRGSVIVDGVALDRARRAERDRFRAEHVGIVHQDFHLLAPFSARENIELGMRFARRVPRRDRRDRAHELLARVGLEKQAEQRPAALSAGERQRVAIARALASRPSIILADEPTGALDSRSAREVFTLLVELCAASGATLLLVTHDHALASELPERFDGSELVRRIDDHGDEHSEGAG